MKEIFIDSIKKLAQDRYLLVLNILMALIGLVAAIIISLSIHPSESQLVARYTAFGQIHFYLGQWYYLLLFAAFPIIVSIINIGLSIKLLLAKGRSLAIFIAYTGIGILLTGLTVFLAILNVWKP